MALRRHHGLLKASGWSFGLYKGTGKSQKEAQEDQGQLQELGTFNRPLGPCKTFKVLIMPLRAKALKVFVRPLRAS